MKTIKAKRNEEKQTYTISVYEDGAISKKYMTVKLSDEVFNQFGDFSEKDWMKFLNSRYSYIFYYCLD